MSALHSARLTEVGSPNLGQIDFSLIERLRDRRSVALVGAVYFRRHYSASVEIDGLLRLVGQMRGSAAHQSAPVAAVQLANLLMQMQLIVMCLVINYHMARTS